MAEKRGRNYQDDGRNQNIQKRQRPNESYQSSRPPHQNDRHFSPKKHGKPYEHRGHHMNRQSILSNSNANVETSSVPSRKILKFLLEQLTKDKPKSSHDQDVLHHAAELHRLLYDEPAESASVDALDAIDKKHPHTSPYVSIPDYRALQPIKLRPELPPLPPIKEDYLEAAVFLHPSDSKAAQGELNYERLEFLGDAYIEIISTRIIYSRFPQLTSGQQAQRREALVKNEQLALYANVYGLGDRIKHSGDIHVSRVWTKVLADVFEAFVAAIVLADPKDGFSTAEKWLTELWSPKLLEEAEVPVSNVDAKPELARMLLTNATKIEYRQERDMEMDKKTGRQKYFFGVYLTGWGYENQWLGSGEGQNQKQAGANAAADALERNKSIIKDASAQKAAWVQQKRSEAVAAKGRNVPNDESVKNGNIGAEKTRDEEPRKQEKTKDKEKKRSTDGKARKAEDE